MAIVCVMSGMADIVPEIHVLTSHFTNGVNDNKHAHHHEIEVRPVRPLTPYLLNFADGCPKNLHVTSLPPMICPN